MIKIVWKKKQSQNLTKTLSKEPPDHRLTLQEKNNPLKIDNVSLTCSWRYACRTCRWCWWWLAYHRASPSHHKKHGKKVDENDSQSKENISNENVILKNLMKNNMITKQCEYCTEFPDDYSVRNMSNPAKYVTNL